MLAYLTHNDCLLHETPAGHPERSERLEFLNARLNAIGILSDCARYDANLVEIEDVSSVHDPRYVDALCNAVPTEGLVRIDADTSIGPNSLNAARRCAGAIVDALGMVLAGHHNKAFCAVRPPGHHAESVIGMGFCLFNSVAVAAAKALQTVERVAILDFDVHHGNGTVEIFKDDPRVLVCSSFQYPFYPYRYQEIDAPNIVNTPLPAGTNGRDFRVAIEREWVSAVESHNPDLIFVSAGFDGHRDDPIGQFELELDDYAWITELLCSLATDTSNGRLISILEGGYDLEALAASVETHLHGLLANH